MQYTALKCILEEKYDILTNVTIYVSFISPNLQRRHSQYVIVALSRSGALLANKEILLAFISRKNNWIHRKNLAIENKEAAKKLKLLKMQQSTPDASN